MNRFDECEAVLHAAIFEEKAWSSAARGLTHNAWRYAYKRDVQWLLDEVAELHLRVEAQRRTIQYYQTRCPDTEDGC